MSAARSKSALPQIAELEDRILFSAGPAPTEGADGAQDGDVWDGADAADATDAALSDWMALWDAADGHAASLLDGWDQLDGFGLQSGDDMAALDGGHAPDAGDHAGVHQLAIVDMQVPDAQQLLQDLLAHGDDMEVRLIDPQHGGLEQLTEILAEYHDLDSIHIISHGSATGLQLGSDWLGEETAEHQAEQIRAWGRSLASDGDLLLYGCDLASTDAGQHLLHQLADLTGADVAASVDATGHATLGGDWDLEYESGQVDADVALSLHVQDGWLGLLANQTPVTNADAYSATEDTALMVDSASGVLANDVDPDGHVFHAAVVSDPSHGSLQLDADGSFVYVPEAHFSGVDTFDYDTRSVVWDSALPAEDNGGTFVGQHGVGLPQIGFDKFTADLVDGRSYDVTLHLTALADNDLVFELQTLGDPATSTDISGVFVSGDTVSWSFTKTAVMTGLEIDARVTGALPSGTIKFDRFVVTDSLSSAVMADSQLLDGNPQTVTLTVDAVADPADVLFHVGPASDSVLNTYTADDQYLVRLTELSDGGYLATWDSDDQDGSQTGVYGQRLDAYGNPVGAEFRVNTETSNDQQFSVSAGLADGGWVTAWESDNQDGSGTGVYAQRYAADGTTVGGEFLVNTVTSNNQGDPDITATADGGFVVVWTHGSSNRDVHGQMYDASGAAVGGEFVVNSYTSSQQDDASVSALEDGGFVVTWASSGQDGSGTGTYGQLFAADGTAVGGEFRVNQTTAGSQEDPEVASLAGGGFVVTWASSSGDSSGDAVMARMYDSSGSPTGGEFRVNSTTSGDQNAPDVAGLANGGFVVAYAADNLDGSSGAVAFQQYDSAGVEVGGEVQANSFTNNNQREPKVVGLAGGGFALAWETELLDGDRTGLAHQVFRPDGTPLPPQVTSVVTNVNTPAPFSLTFAFTDGDGSEVVNSLVVSNIPIGSTIDDGVNSFTAGGTTTVDITSWDWDSLSVTPPLNDAADFTLTFTSRTEETSNGDLSLQAQTLDVVVIGGGGGPPTASDQTLGLNEDQPHVFSAADFGYSDPDGDALAQIRVTSLESAGSLQLSGADVTLNQVISRADIDSGNLVYTPAAHASGAGYDNFQFEVHDGAQYSAAAYQMSFDVTAVADPVTLVVSDVSGVRDTAIALSITSTLIDADGSESQVIEIRNVPAGAALSAGVDMGGGLWQLTPAQLAGLTVTPPLGSSADFTLTVDVTTTEASNSDTQLTSDTIQVTVTPPGGNTAPVATDDNYSTNEDTLLQRGAASGVLANDSDADGDSLTASLVTGPARAAVFQLNGDGSFDYLPDLNFSGVDTFVYQASDGQGGVALATVTLNVASVNDAPQGGADAYSVLGAQNLLVRAAQGLLSNDADADGDPLRAVLVNGPANGTVTVRPNGSFRYSATPGFFGVDQFTYLPNDGTAGGSAVTVTIQVQAAPEPIVPGFPQVDVDSDGDMDQDDERLAIALVSTLTVEEPSSVEAVPPSTPPRRSSVSVPFSSLAGAAGGSLELTDLPSRAEALNAWRLLTSVDSAIVESNLVEQGVRGQLSWFFDPARLWSEVDSQDDPSARPALLFRLGVTAVATTAISAGYIMWSIRGSYLLATLVSSLPAWHAIDPLPVLTAAAQDDDSADDESLSELLEHANLDLKEA